MARHSVVGFELPLAYKVILHAPARPEHRADLAGPQKDALLTSSGMAVDVWLTGVSGTLIPAMPAAFDAGYRWPTNRHARPPFFDQKSG